MAPPKYGGANFKCKERMRFLIAFIFSIFLFSNNAYANESHVNYCEYSTKIEYPSILICHRTPLSDVQINNIKKITKKALNAYPSFITKYDLAARLPSGPIAIVLLSNKEINDPTIFPDYQIGPGLATARFLPNEKIICISKDALSLYDPNLPHELAHLFNSESGIKQIEEDERLAYAFEDFYFAR